MVLKRNYLLQSTIRFGKKTGRIMKLFLPVFFFLCFESAIAQQTDSLLNALKTVEKGSSASGNLNLQIGLDHYKNSEFDKAYTYLQQAEKDAISSKDTSTLIKAINSIGKIHSDKGENPQALRFYQKALKIAEKSKKFLLIAHVQKNIGVLYISWKNFEEALKHYEEAQQQAVILKDEALIADCNNNIATVYEQLKQYEKALFHYNKALAYYLKTNKKTGIAMSYANMAIVYKEQGVYGKAIENNFKALELMRQVGDKWMQAATLNNIGSVYYSMKKFAKTIDYCEQSLKLAQSISAKEIEVACYETLADAAAALRDFELAYHYRVKFHNISQDFINTEKTRQFSELEIKYKTEKKEQKIALLHKQSIIQQLSISRHKLVIGVIAICLLAIIVISVLLFNRNKLKQQALLKQREMQQREVLSHAVITAEENERKRIAGDLHDGVGQLLSAVKMNFNGLIERINIQNDTHRFLAEKTLALMDESCKEVRNISHQMMPNPLPKSGIIADLRNFIHKIDHSVLEIELQAEGFKDNLESNEEVILYRVIQEAINNVFKHSGATKLLLNLQKTKEIISVSIKDNGKGFDTKQSFEGIGLRNIHTRIEYLKGSIEFLSSPNKGTVINISIPL